MTTHGDVGHLTERVVREVGGLLVIALLEVDADEFIGDVALFGNYGHDACVSGKWRSVKLE